MSICAVEGAVGEFGEKYEGAHGKTFAMKSATFLWSSCRQQARIPAVLEAVRPTSNRKRPGK